MKASNNCQLKRKCVSPCQTEMYGECQKGSLNNKTILTKSLCKCVFVIFFFFPLGGSTIWKL